MRRRVLRWVGGATVFVAIWFLTIDWSWFVESCDDCLLDRDVYEYRCLSMPLTREVHTSGRSRDATCRHPSLERWHKHRWWGLLICRCPCHNGVYRLTQHVEHSPSRRG